jgi:putative copper resistance protein D
MQALINFLNTFLENLLLVAYACTIGGLVWNVVLLKAWRHLPPQEERLALSGIVLMRRGAMAIAIVQIAKLAMQAWLLTELFQRSPFPAYFDTLQCQAGLTRAMLAGALAGASLWLGHRPKTPVPWAITMLLTALLVASGAWQVHAVGRSEDRTLLMVITVLHQLGAAAWLGGIIQLGLVWRLLWQQPDLKLLWPALLRRFTWVAGPAGLLLVATGLPLAWTYIGTWQGLIGTGYGTLVLTKVMLLATALGLAGLNFYTARQPTATAGAFQRVPYYVEAETLILIAIIFTAGSLSVQPPAADIVDQQATWAELFGVFRPKVPRLTSPSYAEVVTAFVERGSPRWGINEGVAAYWSDYNHNISGLFLVIIATLALLSQARWLSWTRHWPLGFVALSLFILLRSDAESSWPFGQMGFWEGILANDETLQHRLGALIACILGLIEWQARIKHTARTHLPYIVPALSAVGGLVLLGHSHSAFQPKQEFLIQVTHAAIGLLAVVMACGRWLQLRLTPPAGRLAGFVSFAALLLIGLILLFYRETPIS